MGDGWGGGAVGGRDGVGFDLEMGRRGSVGERVGRRRGGKGGRVAEDLFRGVFVMNFEIQIYSHMPRLLSCNFVAQACNI